MTDRSLLRAKIHEMGSYGASPPNAVRNTNFEDLCGRLFDNGQTVQQDVHLNAAIVTLWMHH